MKTASFESFFSPRTRRDASKAPKSTILRLEALESRELLDAAGMDFENAPPPQLP